MRPLIALAAALALAGCAAPSLELTPAPNAPAKAIVTDVPLIKQAEFYCGPAALAMTLQWTGQDVGQDQIAALAFTPEAQGTFQQDMISAARRRGALAVPIVGFAELTGEIAAGRPVIVFQNLSEGIVPLWHYGVITGYDLERRTVTLQSGQLSRTVMALERFERTWAGGDGWALLVLAPGNLPVSARERAVLDASAGLERAGQTDAAIAAYRAGAARWPKNWLWQFGLGNALYAAGDRAGSRRAFERAIALDPTATAPRQNLATLDASG